MRLISLSWALGGAISAGLLAAVAAGGVSGSRLETALRAAGCGFFYGLLAFHLQRVDPGDSHLQAGLVGAVCGLRSLAAPLDPALLAPPAQMAVSDAALAARLLSAMMGLLGGWLPLWAPLIGSALLLHGVQRWRSSRSLKPGAVAAGQLSATPARPPAE
jgi:hypothetical protein